MQLLQMATRGESFWQSALLDARCHGGDCDNHGAGNDDLSTERFRVLRNPIGFRV